MDTKIKVKLSVIMAEKNINLKNLSAAVGISLTNLSLLKTGKVKAIRFSTLEALCETLDCQPGDIIVYEKEEK